MRSLGLDAGIWHIRAARNDEPNSNLPREHASRRAKHPERRRHGITILILSVPFGVIGIDSNHDLLDQLRGTAYAKLVGRDEQAEPPLAFLLGFQIDPHVDH